VETKARLIETTKQLLWRQGYGATGLNQIIAESGTPRGSIYFHFPGGKEDLTVAALREAGTAMSNAMRRNFERRGLRDGLRAWVRAFARAMRESDWQQGCPIATVTLEAAALSEPIRQMCDAAFDEWRAIFAAELVAEGVDPDHAKSLATTMLSAIEGALILCRAARDVAPLGSVTDELLALLDAESRILSKR
jgi:TetR/AcrR family transcriptional regulator, lmrAB and yxaGH operons repressor